MHDSEVIASFAGDRSGGLTEAYDRYADPLYRYCLAWLGEPAEAAGAVQDTFVIAAARAAARLVDLREPEQLRAWLYAVARNECQRITRPRRPVFASAQAPEVTADVGEDAERARLLDAATRGLTPGEREVIELELRHGLAVSEVAAVVGVSPSQANALASRARKHLEACLGAVVVARAGRRNYCDSLSRMLADWDGQLTVPLRKQLHRHIGRCAACSTRRDLELHPAQPLGRSRGDALAATGAVGLRVAAGPPGVLRDHTLALAAGQDPDAIAHRAAILGRAGDFDSHGFPKPVPGPKEAPARGDEGGPARRRGRVAVASGLAAAAVIGVVAFAVIDGSGHDKRAGGQLSGSAPSTGASAAAPFLASPGTSPTSSATRVAAKATATPKTTASATTAPQGTSTSASRATTPATTTNPSATATAARPTASGTAATPTATSKPAPGTLAVSPSGGGLGVPPGGTTISLTAHGGPVTWSSTVSSGLGTVHLSPSGGTINAGATVTVTVTASGLASGRKVTINPDGTVFTIFVELA
jgi:RNA polymerase sigma factor (sigma-70 family)